MAIPTISEISIDFALYDQSHHAFIRKILAGMNTWVKKINQNIAGYNTLENDIEKNERLLSIEEQVKAMDDDQVEKYLAFFPEYFEKIHGKLFQEIQKERLNFDVELGLRPSRSPLTLAELVAQMDPEKVNEMTAILAQEKGDDLHAALRDLYKPGKAGEEKGKKAFDGFLKTHIITVLGGSNSKNFKVTHRETKKTQVLKVEHVRLPGTKKAESQLREGALSEVLTSVDADRRAIYSDKTTGQPISRSLQVTEFCPGSDIEAYGLLLKNDEFRLISAASFHYEMADILVRMQKAGYAFPDMKNINWLIDSDTRLRIADGKSLTPIDENGNLHSKTGLLKSEEMLAPEMLEDRPFSADKMHAYILGKNLYQYLTGCDVVSEQNGFYRLITEQMPEKNEPVISGPDGRKYFIISDAQDLDFSHPIFGTSKGMQYEALLRATITMTPGDRLSLADFQARIEEIDPDYATADKRQAEILKATCEFILKDLDALAIGSTDMSMEGPIDKTMKAFLKETKDALAKETSVYKLLQITKELDSVRKSIERAEAKKVRAEAKKFNDAKKGFNTLYQYIANSIHLIDGFKENETDPMMTTFSDEIQGRLGSNPSRQTVEETSLFLKDVLLKIARYSKKINNEIKKLQVNGRDDLVQQLRDDMLKVPIKERTADCAICLVSKYIETAEKEKEKENAMQKKQEFQELKKDFEESRPGKGDKEDKLPSPPLPPM